MPFDILTADGPALARDALGPGPHELLLTTARVLLDLAGLVFVAVVLVLISLHLYGALWRVVHGPSRRRRGADVEHTRSTEGSSAWTP